MKKSSHDYWVIDKDTPAESLGTFTAFGPYKTQREAEALITKNTAELWEDSCACLQTDKSADWCKPLHIVKVIRTVQPKITANVKLETV